MTVNGKELWNSLNFVECLRFSPKFRLALKTSESEAELLQFRYKEASEMFIRTSKVNFHSDLALRSSKTIY